MSGKTIEKVEIFAVGTWNGMPFTKEDLNLVAVAFNKLKELHQVPLKMGHNESQPFTDGQPALGWISEIWVEGQKLLAKFTDLPDVVYEAIKSKLYKNVSIELDMGVEHKGDFYPNVLSGVALLGADIPAVNTLADLTAYMKREELTFQKRVAFTATLSKTKKEEIVMSDSEEVKALKLQLAAANSETEKLATDKAALEKAAFDNKIKFRAVEEAEKHRKQVDERKVLESTLEDMVKQKKIAPFTREEYLADYDQAEDKGIVLYSVKKLEKTIDANPAYFGAEQARMKADQTKQEGDKDPSEIVVLRTKEYMAKHGEKSFAAAKTMVLQADTELANRYTKMEA